MLGWLLDALRPTDVVDIGILAYLIYRAVIIIRGTRAVQSLVGLGILAILYVTSQQLHLNSVHWLLDKFFVYLVFAVIVLFQQDIRRGLARAGGNLFPSLRSPGSVPVTEEIIKACFALASRRIGALIAIERGASLDEYLETATRLDSQVHQELLLAIFHPTSPLHDGAVIIQKGRIAAAQVFLPLKLTKDVSRFYGTRHRAALGLTEETDAVVIIVSEERGTVSLVENGQMTSVSDANELRQQLLERFQDLKVEPSPGKREGA